MSVPKPLIDILDILEGVVRGDERVSVGPARVEIPAATVLADPSPLTAPMRQALRDAAFVAITFAASTSASDLERISAVALPPGPLPFLDLSFSGVPDLAGLSRDAAGRTARATFRIDSAGGIPRSVFENAVRAASVIAGQGVLRYTGDPGSPWAGLVADFGRGGAKLDLELHPGTPSLRRTLRESWPAVQDAARTAGVTVSAIGGLRASFGQRPDPVAGFNVLASCYRALLRTRPSLCPFPFFMISWDAGTLRACPAPNGPSTSLSEGEDPWNGPLHRDLRRRFLVGDLHPLCQTCTLLPRVLRSLSEGGGIEMMPADAGFSV